METKNKETVQKLYDYLNKRSLDKIKELISPEYTGPLGEKGPAGFTQNLTPLIEAFPDIQWNTENLISEGSQVFIRWRWEGTQKLSFRNIAPTGKKITNDGMALFTLKEGMILSSHIQTDRLGFLQSLDVLPQNITPSYQGNKDHVSLIDKFLIPTGAIQEFYERMNYNRSFIKKLPGFVRDAAYIKTDDKGNLICVTVAVWQNEAALNNAKELVQAEYKRIGFNPAEFFQRWNINPERAIYHEYVE